jgi:hypothetical protein
MQSGHIAGCDGQRTHPATILAMIRHLLFAGVVSCLNLSDLQYSRSPAVEPDFSQ